MSEFEDPHDHVLIQSEYEPAFGSVPAMLDLVWYDEPSGKNKYVTLKGSAAKKFSHLKAGDIYHDKVS